MEFLNQLLGFVFGLIVILSLLKFSMDIEKVDKKN